MNIWKKLLQLKKNRVIKNAAWLIAGKVFQVLINLVVGLMMARYLGPANYGLISYAQAYAALFSVCCTLGIDSVIVKELIDDPNHEGRIMGTSVTLKALASILSALAIIMITGILDANEPLTQKVVALYSVGLFFRALDTFDFWFQARLQSKISTIAALTAYIVSSAYKLVLLMLGKPVTWFALATAIDYLCLALLLIWFYFREGGTKLSFSWQYGKILLGSSYHYILSGLVRMVYSQTDKIMLKQMINETENGYYSIALSVCNVWVFFLTAIIQSLTPAIMQAHKENREKFNCMNRMLYCIVIYVSTIVSLAFVFLGDWLIPLMYGAAYYPAVKPLKVLTWQTAFSYLGVARSIWIVCENKQKYLKYIYSFSALGNVVLNLLLIPIWGATGAAVASLAAQFIGSVISPLFIPQMRENAVMILEAVCFKKLMREKNTDT